MPPPLFRRALLAVLVLLAAAAAGALLGRRLPTSLFEEEHERGPCHHRPKLSTLLTSQMCDLPDGGRVVAAIESLLRSIDRDRTIWVGTWDEPEVLRIRTELQQRLTAARAKASSNR